MQGGAGHLKKAVPDVRILNSVCQATALLHSIFYLIVDLRLSAPVPFSAALRLQPSAELF